MSSSPSHSRDADRSVGSVSPPPSLAMFKHAVELGPDEPVRDVEAVAKYVALKHPNFVFKPALPSVFGLEFDERELSRIDGRVEQRTTFTVLYGDKPVQEELGSITVRRVYHSLPDMSTPLNGSEATRATVEYTEATTP